MVGLDLSIIVCGYVFCLDVHTHVSFPGSVCVSVVPVCMCKCICVHVCMHVPVCYPGFVCVFRYIDWCVYFCLYMPPCVSLLLCVSTCISTYILLPVCLQHPCQSRDVYPALVPTSTCLMLSIPPLHLSA